MNRESQPRNGNIPQRWRSLLSFLVAWGCLHFGQALFPHGPGAGDIEITADRSSLVSLSPAFPFYGLNLSSVMVYRDAFLCFDNTSRDLYMLERDAVVNFPAIVVWASEVRTANNGGAGSLTYRLSRNEALLQQLSETARNFSDYTRTFYPLYALVATWQAVGTAHYDELSRKKTNSFQVLLASDGRESLVLIEYPTIQWIYDGSAVFYDYGGTIETVDFTRAQIGFYKGDQTTKFLLPASFTPSVRDVATASNVNSSGVYIFRVDTAPVNLTLYSASSGTTHPTMSTEQTSTADTSTLLTTTSTLLTTTITLLTTTSTGNLATESTYEVTDDTVSGPIVGMSVVCVVLALITTVALILVCRLQIKSRNKRFHSRKVGPEEPITVARDNRESLPLPGQATQRVQLHSARSVVSTAGIRVIEY